MGCVSVNNNININNTSCAAAAAAAATCSNMQQHAATAIATATTATWALFWMIAIPSQTCFEFSLSRVQLYNQRGTSEIDVGLVFFSYSMFSLSAILLHGLSSHVWKILAHKPRIHTISLQSIQHLTLKSQWIQWIYWLRAGTMTLRAMEFRVTSLIWPIQAGAEQPHS